jgi:formylmethanofuran dehydrogenase subunit B
MRREALVTGERLETQVPCPACGCVCDDLTLRFNAKKLIAIEPPCALAERWYAAHSVSDRPVAQLHGSPVTLAEAIDRAAEILRSAASPLIFGLSPSALPGQRQAIALAEKLGGALDTSASMTHAAATLAVQEFGVSTCTLGEVRNRADLVIFWGSNPAASNPRHAERYSVTPVGRYLPGGRADRTVVMVGPAGEVESWRLDPAGAKPDHVIALEPGRDFETIAQLRALLRGQTPPNVPEPTRQLFTLLKACRTGVVFFGLGLDDSPASAGHVEVAALFQLVAELNAHARFFAIRMRRGGDAPGAENVLTWQTGYPFAVDFSRGYPRHNPGEFTAQELLARGEVDACLIVGSSTLPAFSKPALAHLASIPTIFLDYPGATPIIKPAIKATVQFTTAVYGLHAEGNIFRMDNVPLPLRALTTSPYPTDEQILSAISAQL